jgi:DNA-binding transcriptional LysR family regulator
MPLVGTHGAPTESVASSYVKARDLVRCCQRHGSIDDILDGRGAIAFTRLLPGRTELAAEVLARESRMVALGSAHRLAGRQSLTFAELRDESFIVNPAVPGAGPPARWLAEQRRHGLPGRIAARAASVQEILALVAAGRGARLVPSAVMAHHPRADVVYVPVTDAEPAVISLSWPPGRLTPRSRGVPAGSPHSRKTGRASRPTFCLRRLFRCRSRHPPGTWGSGAPFDWLPGPDRLRA